MYLYIDSNVFYNNWHVSNADFNLLFNYIENTDAILLISELVCEEVDNLWQRNKENIISTLEENIEKARRMKLEVPEYDFKKLKDETYSLKKVLSEKDISIVFIPYVGISQNTVVARAINKTRPFQENEKGYRDTLIWLSLISYLTERKRKLGACFITKNTNDFYSSGKKELQYLNL